MPSRFCKLDQSKRAPELHVPFPYSNQVPECLLTIGAPIIACLADAVACRQRHVGYLSLVFVVRSPGQNRRRRRYGDWRGGVGSVEMKAEVNEAKVFDSGLVDGSESECSGRRASRSAPARPPTQWPWVDKRLSFNAEAIIKGR